jgi:hypothetical protein
MWYNEYCESAALPPNTSKDDLMEKTSKIVVCAFCGALLVGSNFHARECNPKVELCSPPAIEQHHVPENAPTPGNTTFRATVVTSASSTMNSLGSILIGRRSG